MNRNLRIVLVVAVVGVAIAAVVLNRVAIHAFGLRVNRNAQEAADRQRLDNWELFFHNSLERLGTAIESEGARLRQIRVEEAKERIALERAEGTLATYREVEEGFVQSMRQAGEAPFTLHGRTYSPDAAQAQLHEYAGAIVEQQRRVAECQGSVQVRQQAVAALENNLRVARQQMRALRERGTELVRQRSLAELKALSLEMSSVNAGLDPQGPLSGPMADIQALLARMQEHNDGLAARSEVVVATPTGTTPVLSIEEAVRQLNYSEREKDIDREVEKITQD